MADHQELVAEMPTLEQMATQERQKLAKKRRLQQLKKWSQREKEFIAKEKQFNKRLANKLSEENNGLNLKQYITYSSNERIKKRIPNTTAHPNNAQTNGNATSNNIKNNITNNNNNSCTQVEHNREDLKPNGRVHFGIGVMLLEAAARNDFDEVKRLLMLGVSPDSVNHDGLTALHQCCIDASEPMMKLLLKHGANIDARDTEQWTPLHAACTCGHINLVKVLVENGANLLAVNGDGNMPFDICEDETTLDYIESQMVKQGITQEMIDTKRASTELQMMKDLESLVSNHSDLNLANDNGVTPLHIASANGYTSVVKFLIQNGADVNSCDNDRWSPLHGVACWGTESHIKIVELLVEAGANLNAKTMNDETVFDLCDNTELLSRLNQLKDEQESKQANGVSQLKRTQSRSNSRIHSVRRTSHKDKNLISRMEARQEALIRAESMDFDDIKSSLSDQKPPLTNSISQDSTAQSTNQTRRPLACDSIDVPRIKQSPKQTDIDDPAAMVDGSDDDLHAQEVEQSRKEDESQVINGEIDHTTPSSSRKTPTAEDDGDKSTKTHSSSELDNRKLNRTTISIKHNQQQLRSKSEIICDPNDQQQVNCNDNPAAPITYTLSNLKKQRSDLRMRTSSIGGYTPSVTAINHHNNRIDQAANGRPCDRLDECQSPDANFRKYSGESSEPIEFGQKVSRTKCCIVM